jgi:hypothetical protein
MFKTLYIVVRARALGMRTVRLHGHGSLTWNTSLRTVPLCTACARTPVCCIVRLSA